MGWVLFAFKVTKGHHHPKAAVAKFGHFILALISTHTCVLTTDIDKQH